MSEMMPGSTGGRLWIYQPYVPAYRVAFFEGIIDRLRSDGISTAVVVPDGHGTDRGDDVSADYPWVCRQSARRGSFRGRTFHVTQAPVRFTERDAVVVGLQGTLPDAWNHLLRVGRRHSVGVWGHVGSYVAPGNRVDIALERWQMRRSDHVFAYTENGAALARAAGVHSERVTAVMNSVDVSYLEDPGAPARAALLRARYGLGSRVVGYVGALDSAKRVDFLARSLEELWIRDPSLKVLVGGRGPDEHLLANASARGQAVLLGRADAPVKAAMADLCRAFLMPGRVGLVAVETLAMGRPLVTTRWPFHAPEFEYLQPGVSVVLSDDDAVDFARAVIEACDKHTRRVSWPYPSVSGMVSNFADGVLTMRSTTRHLRGERP